MRRQGKKYVEASSKVDNNMIYPIDEAINLVKETSITKFDSTIEVAIRTNVDPKINDHNLRGALVLPNGTGKTKVILVLAKGKAAEEAIAAKADYVGEKDLIEKIEKENWFNYDIIVATPEMMPLLGKIGKTLGPKGLMPNPKTGTVDANVKKMIEELKKGKAAFKNDDGAIVHIAIGKVSFDEIKLKENYEAFMEALRRAKPNSTKGTYIKSAFLTSSMGPSIKIEA